MCRLLAKAEPTNTEHMQIVLASLFTNLRYVFQVRISVSDVMCLCALRCGCVCVCCVRRCALLIKLNIALLCLALCCRAMLALPCLASLCFVLPCLPSPCACVHLSIFMFTALSQTRHLSRPPATNHHHLVVVAFVCTCFCAN